MAKAEARKSYREKEGAKTEVEPIFFVYTGKPARIGGGRMSQGATPIIYRATPSPFDYEPMYMSVHLAWLKVPAPQHLTVRIEPSRISYSSYMISQISSNILR